MMTTTFNKSDIIKFGSSPSLAMMVKLIAKFYCTSEDRVQLTGDAPSEQATAWKVFVGGKAMTGVKVCKQRGRFVFQSEIVGVQA